MRPLSQDPERVRRRRIEAGLNLPALAAKAAMSKGHLSNIENGKVSPTAKTLGRLAAALDCEIADLMPPPEPTAVTDGAA